MIVGIALGMFSVAAIFHYWSRTQERLAASDFSKTLQVVGQSSLQTLDGKPFDLREYAGREVAIFFWASWCPSCGEEIAALSRIVAEHPHTIPLIAINRKETLDLAKDYLLHVGISNDITYVVSDSDDIYASVGGFAMPELVIFGTDGTVQVQRHGVSTEEELRSLLAPYRTP